MSKIDKLSIMGVRSFGPITRETIQFNTPLTLIVGYNGSGKTTIIECLKYATTGDLPPNSKGGAFIHDPKLCNEREVMAQVKLKFKTPPDTSHVVTRSLQLTVKKTQRSQKTLEGSISTTREGEKSTISSKNSDLDTLMSQFLGVAPAILDAVIFCHQDESLWPMSEPSVLKKRFDEIFEAMKYTKAIENLKLLRKKQGEQLTILKVQEGQEKTNKEKADRCERRSIALQDEIEDLRMKCKYHLDQMKEAEASAKALRQEANSYLGITNDFKFKSQQLDIRQSNLEETRMRMDELQESDSWLEDSLVQYEERTARYQNDHEEGVARYNVYREQLSDMRIEMSNKQAERGKLQSDREKYERQLEYRVELVRNSSQQHEIRGFDGELSDHQVQSFLKRMQKLLNDKKGDLGRLQQENAQELDSRTAVISDLEGRRAASTQNRVTTRQKIAAIDKRIMSLQGQVNSVDTDEGGKALLDSSFLDIGERLDKANKELRDAELDSKISHENEQLQHLENESAKLSQELVECTRLASDRAQLDLRRNELAEKRRKLGTLTDTWSQKISAMVNEEWKPATVEQEFQVALQNKNKIWDEERRKRDDLAQELRRIQSSLSDAKSKAKKRDDEMESCKSAVRQAMLAADPDEANPSIDDLPDAISEVERHVLELEKDIALAGSLKQYFQQCEKILNSENRCELCSRPFGNEPTEKSKILKKIKQGMKTENADEWRAELRETEKQLGALRAVRPKSETFTRLSSEKSAANQSIHALESETESTTRKLESLDESVNQKREERQDLESMQKTILNISQTYKDIQESESQVERIQSQQQSSSSVRSANEIHELQDNCNGQMKASKNRLTKLTNDKQRMRDLANALELERSELRNKISNAERQLERKKDLEHQIQALKEELVNQKEAIQKADEELEEIEPKISQARAAREDALEQGRSKEKVVATERDEVVSSVNELNMVGSDIDAYEARGGPAALGLNEKAIESLQGDIARTETDIGKITERIEKLKEEISNSAANKKNIVDNLQYRKTLREIEKLRREVDELASRNADEDYDRTTEEAQAIESRRDILNAERGAMMGVMKTKDEELGRLLVEWETDYHDAAHKYRETHIKVETTKAAIEDLGRYGQALNNAIMRYHALKMEEVNRIAGELWQGTYQGTDIDTILIKSDSESATGRSSYNYRVCMVKQDTEMDMRGRCSAGQKVLASIIIRLALAESFGTNCGLIALDEPTTNLDRDNIRSLAESLHEIIKARRAQSNFQLIVITHDEEFLRHMRCSEFCDHFYRVTRNDKQTSQIRPESISTVV